MCQVPMQYSAVAWTHSDIVDLRDAKAYQKGHELIGGCNAVQSIC